MKRQSTTTGHFDYCWQGQDEIMAINVVIAYRIEPQIPATYHRWYGWSPPEGGDCEWFIERWGRCLLFGEVVELTQVQRAQFEDLLTEQHYDEIENLCREREDALADIAGNYEEY